MTQSVPSCATKTDFRWCAAWTKAQQKHCKVVPDNCYVNTEIPYLNICKKGILETANKLTMRVLGDSFTPIFRAIFAQEKQLLKLPRIRNIG
jgi:hypothetical protein